MENDSSDDNGNRPYGLFMCGISTPFAAVSGIDVSFLHKTII